MNHLPISMIFWQCKYSIFFFIFFKIHMKMILTFLYCLENGFSCQSRRQVTHDKPITHSSVSNNLCQPIRELLTIYLEMHILITNKNLPIKTIFETYMIFSLSRPSYATYFIFFLSRQCCTPNLCVPTVVQILCQVAHKDIHFMTII